MQWTYTQLPDVEKQIAEYPYMLLNTKLRPTTDDEIKSFNYIELACQELNGKLERYKNGGPDPRDEFKNAKRIALKAADTYYLHHKGLYVFFYRDILITHAVAMGFLRIETRIKSFVAKLLGR